MAIGTITVQKKIQASGAMRTDLIRFTGDTSYTTGGTAAFESKVQAALEAGNVDIVAIVPQDCGGYQVAYDRDNDKLKVYRYDYDAGADGPAAEVPATTNLTTTTFNLLVISN